jgi:TonB family protein
MKGTGFRIRLWGAAGVLFALGGLLCPAQDGAWEQVVAAGDQALAARDYGAAEQRYQTALEQAQGFGPSDPRKPEVLMRLARLYRAQGDFAKPEDLYRQALREAEAVLDPQSPELARYFNEVGRYYHARRKYDLAGEYYRKAFALRVKIYGKEHAEVADSINNLAVLFENQAINDKAEVYYDYALKIREKALGPDDVHTIETLEHFGRLLQKLNRAEEAGKMLERCRAYRAARIEELSAGARLPGGEAVAAGPGIQPPQLEERVEPEYTEEARIARHEGTVVLQADISPDGHAGNFRLVRSLGLGLDEKAVEAVRRWVFKPARRGKDVVTFHAVLEIHFRVM